MTLDPTLHRCPRLPKEVEIVRQHLIREYGQHAESEMWKYVSWYDSRFGITDLRLVWIRAVNRVSERHRFNEHKTG